jgi:hypothetical protein
LHPLDIILPHSHAIPLSFFYFELPTHCHWLFPSLSSLTPTGYPGPGLLYNRDPFALGSLMHPETQASPAFQRANTWVDTARYLGVTLVTRLTWSAHVNQVVRKAAQRWGVLGPLLNRRSSLSIKNGVLLYKQLIHPMMATHARSGGLLPTPTSVSCRCCNPSVFALQLTHPGTLVTGKFTTIWGFHSLPTTSEH